MTKYKYDKAGLARRRKRLDTELVQMKVRADDSSRNSKIYAVGMIVVCSLVILALVVFVF